MVTSCFVDLFLLRSFMCLGALTLFCFFIYVFFFFFIIVFFFIFFFFSSRRRHTRLVSDWSSDVCSSDLDTNLNTDEKDPTGVGPTPAHPDGTIPSHPDYTRQQFGGSVGGPFKKDKLFGFFALEREREHQAQTVDPTSLNELTIAKANGFADQPATTIPRPFFEWRYNGRSDWVINTKNSVYLSYTSQVNDSLNDQTDATMDLTEGNFTRNHMIVSNLTWNSLLSNTTVNQLTFGYQYWNNLIDSNLRAPNVIFTHASFGTNTN